MDHRGLSNEPFPRHQSADTPGMKEERGIKSRFPVGLGYELTHRHFQFAAVATGRMPSWLVDRGEKTNKRNNNHWQTRPQGRLTKKHDRYSNILSMNGAGWQRRVDNKAILYQSYQSHVRRILNHLVDRMGPAIIAASDAMRTSDSESLTTDQTPDD